LGIVIRNARCQAGRKSAIATAVQVVESASPDDGEQVAGYAGLARDPV
jgi:hypothetical protein